MTKADVKAELGGGADIMAWNRIGGRTPLHFAVAFETSVKFQTLPSAGGDVNARTDERYRSLYLATSSGAF